MNFFQKFENAYSCVIRLLTMLFTLGLLAGAVLVGINWLRVTDVLLPESKTSQTQVPKVSTDKVIGKVVSGDSGNSDDSAPASATNATDTDDPDYPSYQRIDHAVGAFLQQHHIDDSQKVGDQIVDAVRQSASHQDTDALTHAYVSGAADTIERALASPALVAKLDLKGAHVASSRHASGVASTASAASAAAASAASAARAARDEDSDSASPDKSSAAADVDDLLAAVVSQYDAEFTRQVEKSAKAAEKKDSEHSREQRLTGSASILGRYVGLLILALLVLQALTFGRIEQSMRALAGALTLKKSSEATPPEHEKENGKNVSPKLPELPETPESSIANVKGDEKTDGKSDEKAGEKGKPPASDEDKPASTGETGKTEPSTDGKDAPAASAENKPPAEDKIKEQAKEKIKAGPLE